MPNTAKNKTQFNIVVENKTADQLRILAEKGLTRCPCCGTELADPIVSSKYKGQKPSALAAKIIEKVVQQMIDDEIL